MVCHASAGTRVALCNTTFGLVGQMHVFQTEWGIEVGFGGFYSSQGLSCKRPSYWIGRQQQGHYIINKSAQSNLWRGPRRDTVAHVRRKVPIGYELTMARPKFAPKSTPSRGRISKPRYLPHVPSDLRCQTASGSDPPFFHIALDRPTDRRTYIRTYGPTDRPRERLDDYRPLRYESDAA